MTHSKDTNLVVRVSSDQKEQVERAAARAGLTLADYVRAVLALSTQSRTVGAWVDRSVASDLDRETAQAR
jgi:uncharacterized protein (DUF1778 family)